MTRVSYLTVLFLLISSEILAQCTNPPKLTLSSTSGSTCGIEPVTVSGNTFGGGAILVFITDNGKGSVSSFIVTSSPFTFTYTPRNEDLGKKVEITITTNDPPGRRCRALKVTYTLSVNAIPSAPGLGTITQPTCSKPTGSVLLKDLPDKGTWTLTGTQGGNTYSGTGATTTVSGLAPGIYNFRVENSGGCSSGLSGDVNIAPSPPVPTINVTDPSPVCFPSTADLTATSLTAGSSTGITFTYWRNSDATRSLSSPATTDGGTYYIKGTAENGCSDIKPVTVTVKHPPETDAGPDKVLDYQFTTNVEALEPGPDETGKWSVLSGSGLFADYDDATTVVRNLSLGNNAFLWTLSNGVCPPSADTLNIMVKDLVIPTLITPNMDGRNDFLVIGSKEMPGKMELIVFDRRGIQVYRNLNYENKWDGYDSDGNPLPEGTYFYFLKTEIGKTTSGYIVIRR